MSLGMGSSFHSVDTSGVGAASKNATGLEEARQAAKQGQLKAIATIPEAAAEGREENGDGDSSAVEEVPVAQSRFPSGRTLDQLNQTQALLKAAEARKETQEIIQKYNQDKDYVEDTKEDRNQLLQFKHLPSIREKLFSIKSKYQKAVLDPKFSP